MQKAEKKGPVIDANRVLKPSIRSELKKIREENPRLFKALSIDKFD